ncbi:MAG: TIGR03936 family radical SAM-associated protein [Candidatus Omnitrophota bacterium]
MYKLKFIFSKKGLMIYIGHLDLMRLFTRAMRRADLPLKMSEGFSPHPKFGLRRALKLGLESDNEEGIVALRVPQDEQEFKNKLQEQLPEGIEIKHVERNFS